MLNPYSVILLHDGMLIIYDSLICEVIAAPTSSTEDYWDKHVGVMDNAKVNIADCISLATALLASKVVSPCCLTLHQTAVTLNKDISKSGNGESQDEVCKTYCIYNISFRGCYRFKRPFRSLLVVLVRFWRVYKLQPTELYKVHERAAVGEIWIMTRHKAHS